MMGFKAGHSRSLEVCVMGVSKQWWDLKFSAVARACHTRLGVSKQWWDLKDVECRGRSGGGEVLVNNDGI